MQDAVLVLVALAVCVGAGGRAVDRLIVRRIAEAAVRVEAEGDRIVDAGLLELREQVAREVGAVGSPNCAVPREWDLVRLDRRREDERGQSEEHPTKFCSRLAVQVSVNSIGEALRGR